MCASPEGSICDSREPVFGTFRVGKVGSTTSVAVVLGAFSGTGGSTGGGDIFFEGDVRLGNSPAFVNFENNVRFGSAIGLTVELGGTAPGTQYDQVHVSEQRLIEAARAGKRIDGISGPDRAMLYSVAAWTGFRKGELGSLTLRSLRLDDDPPTATVEACYSKHRRRDTQILHPDVVRLLRERLAKKRLKPETVYYSPSPDACRAARSGRRSR